MLTQNRPAIYRALADDMRKPQPETEAGEIAPVIAEIDHALHHLRQWMNPVRVHSSLLSAPSKSRFRFSPHGTVLIIGPWNYPLGLVLTPLVSALAAGNCALLKPSEFTPAAAELLKVLCERYFDSSAVTCILGGPSTTRAAISKSPDLVFFTGGTSTGREIMKQCADKLIPSVLELGGCNPCIVDKSCHIPTAARRIAWGKFFNAGQTCLAPNMCYVHAEIADDFIGELRQTIREFYGDNPRQSPDFARIVNARHFSRLEALLGEAGTVYEGGSTAPEERYLSPTVVTPSSGESPLVSEEIFGPILPIVYYRELPQVINDINKRPPPLNVYLFTRDRNIRSKVQNHTRSGSFCCNGTMQVGISPRLPFGGIGASGTGRYHGKAGFVACSYIRSELFRSSCAGLSVIYPPYRTPRWLLAKLIHRLL